MKIQLMSDTHFECHADKGRGFLKAIEPAAEVLVLAGDVASARFPEQLVHVFNSVLKKFKHVVYVPGNHEFYGTTLRWGWQSVRRAAEVASIAAGPEDRLHVLDNSYATVDGVVFYGGTGWFPKPPPTVLTGLFSDFIHIRQLAPEVYQRNADFPVGLRALRPDVVVSHHLPSEACVSLRWKGNQGNVFFVSGFDVAGIAPRLWLHGHTHDQVDVRVGPTRVVANPFGYWSEPANQAAFQPKLVVEV